MRDGILGQSMQPNQPAPGSATDSVCKAYGGKAAEKDTYASLSPPRACMPTHTCTNTDTQRQPYPPQQQQKKTYKKHPGEASTNPSHHSSPTPCSSSLPPHSYTSRYRGARSSLHIAAAPSHTLQLSIPFCRSGPNTPTELLYSRLPPGR